MNLLKLGISVILRNLNFSKLLIDKKNSIIVFDD